MTKSQRENLIRILYRQGWQLAAISFRIWNEGGHQQEVEKIIYADCKRAGQCDLGQKGHEECNRKFMANYERYGERLDKFCKAIDPATTPEYPPWVDGQDIIGIEIERRRKTEPDLDFAEAASSALRVSILQSLKRLCNET